MIILSSERRSDYISLDKGRTPHYPVDQISTGLPWPCRLSTSEREVRLSLFFTGLDRAITRCNISKTSSQ